MIETGLVGRESHRLDRRAERRIGGDGNVMARSHERPRQRDHRIEVPEPDHAGEQHPHDRFVIAEAYCIG